MKRVTAMIMFLLLIGCGPSTENSTMATINEMESFNDVVPESEIVIEDEDDITTIQRAINSGSAQEGAVDIADPDFMIRFTDEAFYIWTSTESGSVIDVEDTHTLHTMSNRGNDDLREILQRYYSLEK